MVNSYSLLSALQSFIEKRNVDPNAIKAEDMVSLMIDWFRLVRVDNLEGTKLDDALIYRYGGWSEGCATGFKVSLLRRVRAPQDPNADEYFAGITLMFEPAGYSHLKPVSIASSDWVTIESFMVTIQESPAYKATAKVAPVAVLVESGGLR